MTKLIFVRHGITEENRTYHLIGTTDVPLGSIGLLQAHCVAAILSNEPIGLIATSPLLRAKQTAAQIEERHPNARQQTISELQEIYLGAFDGLDSFQAYKDFPEILDRALDESTSDFAFPNGELRSHALSRFQAAISNLTTTYSNEVLCIVTHGGPLGLWFADLNHQKLGAFRRYQPKHGSISEVEWTDSEFKIVRFNDCSHLHE